MLKKIVLPVFAFVFVNSAFADEHRERHIQQLYSINTMVGTAQANTKSAGMFGKGSEEHGQTLPAVLTPNGQNFWTPQTQDTEQKCIAPYYYKDTELQGFRNSHWIVGGCTQDYGSFTVATITGNLRLQPAERATRFSHNDEQSHPHYYAVTLPDEHITTEMTALSHSSVFRTTSDEDNLLHIVINPNSDEAQGYIEIDTINHLVYGYNPVHRIYQGWGEEAGFAGHFVLRYDKELVDYGVFNKEGKALGNSINRQENIGAWLTFRVKKGEPFVFHTASSFTGKEGALANMQTELEPLGYDFARTMEQCQDAWIKRLHCFDIEDKNTELISQFYGALYRASFLPHEISDCDGAYPKFNGADPLSLRQFFSPNERSVTLRDAERPLYGEQASLNKENLCNSRNSLIKNENKKGVYYGDFSMWDVYRGVLPLYNIIAPTMAGDMMQSLVTMYEEGGWLPIFPCWNSYTAAMIGDHCAVALADAYIKGIRNFDYEKAYEAMRKNAFETPSSFEDYKNGMGRRALDSYLKYGYIPLEDEVKEAFHDNEQTSRTLEYAFDDFAVAQMAKALGKKADYKELMRRSENWRNVINPVTGYADGRYADGHWENNTDLVHRKSYITEGATCHYTWYVPHNIEGLKKLMGDKTFEQRLDTMFTEGRYWHGNEPCHQIAYLYNYTRSPWKTSQWVSNIMQTEYNNTPGGLSGNDDAGQMSVWYLFAALGFYPVCPATPYYETCTPLFDRVTLNLENGNTFVITKDKKMPLRLKHSDITGGK